MSSGPSAGGGDGALARRRTQAWGPDTDTTAKAGVTALTAKGRERLNVSSGGLLTTVPRL